MAKQTRNIINVSLTLLAIYLYSFTANNIETEILGFNSFKFLISMAVLIQFVIFLPSFLFQTEKFYDLTGSLTYISVTSIAYFSLENPSTILKTEVYTRYKQGEAVIDKDFSYTEFYEGEKYLGNMLYDNLNDYKQNTDISKLSSNELIVKKYRKKLKVMREKVNKDPFH